MGVMSALYPRLARNRSRRVVAGVASGVADHLGVEDKWVRMFFVAASFAGGFGPLLYAGLWMCTPLDDSGAQRQRPGTMDLALVVLGFAGALVALQLSSGAGATVVFVLGVLIVGAVIALQAYDRGTGSWGNIAALMLGALLVMAGVLAVAFVGESAGVGGVVVSVLVTVVGVAVLVVPLIAKPSRAVLSYLRDFSGVTGHAASVTSDRSGATTLSARGSIVASTSAWETAPAGIISAIFSATSARVNVDRSATTASRISSTVGSAASAQGRG